MLLVCGMIFAASVFGINPAEDFQSAMKLYNGGKYAEAEKDFLAAGKNTVEQEKKALVYESLGNLYREVSKDNQKVLDAYEEIVKLMSEPKPSPSGGYLLRALVTRAKILASQGKGEEALSEVGKLKNLEFKDPSWSFAAQFCYGEVYETIGKNSEALESYRKAAAVGNARADLIENANKKITELEKKTQKQ